jgi:hypothetical protein
MLEVSENLTKEFTRYYLVASAEAWHISLNMQGQLDSDMKSSRFWLTSGAHGQCEISLVLCCKEFTSVKQNQCHADGDKVDPTK